MIKIDAVSLSFAGDKYIGRSYKIMDCQAFIEQCMADCGLRMDLAGSNAWYREVKKNGWVGSPEECIKIFGSIPKGALLFIHAFDGGEEKRGYHDGLGNASHVGIVTHRNDGAIHSSSSRGCVATSVFKDKTIRNGGWNMVGLWNRIDYGKSINWILEHIGIGQAPAADQDPVQDPDPAQYNSGNPQTPDGLSQPDRAPQAPARQAHAEASVWSGGFAILPRPESLSRIPCAELPLPTAED